MVSAEVFGEWQTSTYCCEEKQKLPLHRSYEYCRQILRDRLRKASQLNTPEADFFHRYSCAFHLFTSCQTTQGIHPKGPKYLYCYMKATLGRLHIEEVYVFTVINILAYLILQNTNCFVGNCLSVVCMHLLLAKITHVCCLFSVTDDSWRWAHERVRI